MRGWFILAPTYIVNIYSGYSFYNDNDIFHYNSKFRDFLRKQSGLTGWTVDHHILPKCLSKHPTLHTFNINSGQNLKIMPKNTANVSSYILRHTVHPAYNRYVKKHLDQIYFEPDEENRRYQLYLLIHDLEQKLNFGELPF